MIVYAWFDSLANSSIYFLKLKDKKINQVFSYLFCVYLGKVGLISESFSILQKMGSQKMSQNLNFSIYFKKKKLG